MSNQELDKQDVGFEQAYKYATKTLSKREVDQYIAYAERAGKVVGAKEVLKFVEMALRRREIRKL